MKRWVLAAGLLAAAVAPQAFAADLDDGEPPPPYSWKGPKWKDSDYGYPPKNYMPPPGYHDDEDDGPSPYSKKYSYDSPPPYRKDDKYERYDDEDDGPPSKKYTDVPPHKDSCVRSEQVRDRLTSLGWRDFHAGKAADEGTVKLRARRPTGRLFELRLDRCSGVILEARAIELSPLRPYYSHKQPPTYDDDKYGYKRPPYGGGPYSYGGPYGPPRYWGPYAGRPYGYDKQPPPGWDD